MTSGIRAPSSSKGLAVAKPAAPPRYVPGEIIADKYRLESLLGEGGMGEVWRAKNLALDVEVAIKLIRADFEAAGAAERLLTEARAAARLRHPNIVRVFDFGQTRRDDPYIVMELLHGETLGELLDREARLPATSAVQILLPIADALYSAHTKGITHRDMKPDNVFVAESEGRILPKVVDFGIVKLEAGPTNHTPKLTQAGTVLGSPDYMAPEQARGLDDVDQRADVWAFCVVLYETITGSVPFPDKNYNALLRAIIEDEIPPSTEYGAGDAELWEILVKGFAKDRSKRWQSLRELGEALAEWLLQRGISEDVCGQSLRAAWLEVPSNPPSMRASYPFLFRRDPAGELRLTPRSAPGDGRPSQIPTLPPPEPRQEHTTPPVSGPAFQPQSPSKGRYLIAGGVGIAVISLVIFLMTGRRSQPAPSTTTQPSPAAAPVPVSEAKSEPVQETPAKAAPAASNSAQPEASAGAENPPNPAKHQRPAKGAKPSSNEKPATKAKPAPSQKPAELKSPYDQDLGF